MKVAIKNKTEWKYIDAGLVEINGKPLANVYDELKLLKLTYQRLIQELNNKFIVDKDAPYIVQIGDKLELVEKLLVHEAKDLDKPLEYYKVVNGQLVVDNKKVGAV